MSDSRLMIDKLEQTCLNKRLINDWHNDNKWYDIEDNYSDNGYNNYNERDATQVSQMSITTVGTDRKENAIANEVCMYVYI